ncbi:hypothetical protein HD554DRAFT_2178836 [Boletus coccyginus]|nr:hypothetical protein HD554DRAFT_2178836 [Boletus coccyginus]
MAPRTLPIGLERMVFLLVPRKTAHTCLVVARRVKVWLEPHLYWAVCLTTNTRARRFLMSMDHRPDFALDHSQDSLPQCFYPSGYGGIYSRIAHSTNLSHLNVLCVDLSSIFNTRTIYLPNVPIFHRITRLHLTNAWATWNPAGNSIGLEELKQLTHLSLHLSTSLSFGRDLLSSYHAATCVLLGADLKDERVLVLDDELLRHHMLDDNLWTSAEHVIKQRRNTEVTPSDGNDDVIMPYIAKPADPGFHSEVGWMVKTDEDP